MKHFKDFNALDRCLFALYVFLFVAICLFLYRLVDAITCNAITLIWHSFVTPILSLFMFIVGVSSVFRCGLVKYFFYKNPEMHSPDSLEYHSREGAAICLFFSFTFLLISFGNLHQGSWFGRVGIALFYSGALIFMLRFFYERMES